MMAINVTAIGLFGIGYTVRKVIIVRRESLDDEEKSRKISETKELVYRNLFFVLYDLSEHLFEDSRCHATCLPQALPRRKGVVQQVFKSRLQRRVRRTKVLIGAYNSAAYIVVLPAASFIALGRQVKSLLAAGDAKITQHPEGSMEMITGMRFLFQNYKPRSWFFMFKVDGQAP